MTLLDVSKLDAVGAPLYDMRKIFQIDAPASKISFSLITIHPGSRVPEVGDGFHSGDEYSYFLEGEVYTVSGDDVGTVGRHGHPHPRGSITGAKTGRISPAPWCA